METTIFSDDCTSTFEVFCGESSWVESVVWGENVMTVYPKDGRPFDIFNVTPEEFVEFESSVKGGASAGQIINEFIQARK